MLNPTFQIEENSLEYSVEEELKDYGYKLESPKFIRGSGIGCDYLSTLLTLNPSRIMILEVSSNKDEESNPIILYSPRR